MSHPRVCVTVGAADTTALVARRDAAADDGADLVELRLDAVDRPDVARALAGRRTPVVVTCRAEWEGGRFQGTEADRLALLGDAWRAGAEFVDVEWAAPDRAAFLAATRGERVIVSWHSFETMPADLAERFAEMCGSPAAVVKVAAHAARLDDTLRLLDLRAIAGGKPFVALAMGQAGVPTRVLGPRLGSAWTYAGDGWAPGQVPLRTLAGQYRYHAIDDRTELYGVVGRPIGHSVSPAMHNAAFAAWGRNAVYLPLEAADADDVVRFAEAWGLRGASVTAPFKQALAGRARLDEVASRVGAVNTLVRDGSGWLGTNTDVQGFLAPLRARVDLRGARLTILGAGGAARAVAIAAVSAGACPTVCARRDAQARDAAAATGALARPWPPAPGSWDVLVNTTPVGTAPKIDESPWPDGCFDGALVYDLVYNPRQTRLLRDAAAAGCQTLDGLEMLVAQAGLQLQIWTGATPDIDVMRAAAEAALAARD